MNVSLLKPVLHLLDSFSKGFYSIKLAYNFIRAIITEYLNFYYVYLLLSLPMYMFEKYNKEIKLRTDTGYNNIWIISVKLVMRNVFNQYDSERISSTQLLLLSNEFGQITFNDLEKFYPTLYTIHIQYLDLKQKTLFPNELLSEQELKFNIVNRIIDIKKRIDIRSAQKCKFGRIQI